MKGARRRKNAACVLPAAYSGTRTAHYRSRHKFVDSTIYDALLNAFFFVSTTRFLASHKEQRFRLHEHCLTPALARSTHAYMHVSRQSAANKTHLRDVTQGSANFNFVQLKFVRNLTPSNKLIPDNKSIVRSLGVYYWG